MPWVDLFQHMNAQPGVTITARGGEPGRSYWDGEVTLEPDVRAVLQYYSCGDPFQEYLPPNGERGGVTYNNFNAYSYTSYGPPRINAIYPYNDSGFALSTGTRIRVRARFVGDLTNPSYPDDWSAEGAGQVGFVFLDTSGGGLYVPSAFADFNSMGRDDWTGWREHEITSGDTQPTNWAEFQGIGHETSWPDSSGPPRYGMEVEWQIWVEPNLIAVADTDTVRSGASVTTSVLANDTLDGVPVSLDQLAGVPVITRQPTNGRVMVNADGTITYTPNSGFSGQDTYEYEIEVPEGN